MHPDTDSSLAGRLLARSTAALVSPYDVTGLMSRLLDDCVEALGADSAGLLVSTERSLELLSATSHRAVELELMQSQTEVGPCVEAIRSHEVVSSDSYEDMASRWPAFSAVAERAGYRSLHACPMTWQGRVIGGLNLFYSTPGELTSQQMDCAQAFADVSTLAILNAGGRNPTEIAQALKSALRGRTVIEQAKGVLAHQRDVGMEQAYAILKERAATERRSIGEVAGAVVEGARR
jgi:GAF domain-containing protein